MADTPSGVGNFRDDHLSETGNKLLVIIVQNWLENSSLWYQRGTAFSCSVVGRIVPSILSTIKFNNL